MKIGLVLECVPGGPDEQVFRCLIERFWSGVHQVHGIRALRNKARLMAGCAEAVASLLDQGCDRVLVVWDLQPPQFEADSDHEAMPAPPLQHDCVREVRRVRQQMDSEGLPAQRVVLLNIDDELEAMLIGDAGAIKTVIADELAPRLAKPVKSRRDKRSKKTLEKWFRAQGLVFADREHDLKILRKMSTKRLLKTAPVARLVADDKLGAPVSDVDCVGDAGESERRR